MTQPKCDVCGRFVQTDYILPKLCDTHLDEAFMNFVLDDDEGRDVV